jgi:hypothetical protein
MFFSAFFIFLWRGFWILDSPRYFWVRPNLGRAGGAGPRRSHVVTADAHGVSLFAF